MLNQPTLEKLQMMKLYGMADAFRAQLQTTDMSQLSFEERFAMLVDQQWLWKENRALARRLRLAKLKERGVIEDIDYQHPRGLDRKLIRTLASSEWVRQHQNVLLLGPTGIGKTWLGCALALRSRSIPSPTWVNSLCRFCSRFLVGAEARAATKRRSSSWCIRVGSSSRRITSAQTI